MKKSSSSQRREFLKNSIGILSAISLTGIAAQAAEERRRKKPEASGGDAKGGEVAMVDPATDPMAKSTNYVAKKADLKKPELKTERQGVKFEDQSCAKCALFSGATKKGGKEVGQCTLYGGKYVEAAGWCSSWAKKA